MMRLRYRIASGAAILLGGCMAVLGIAMSYNSSCPAANALTETASTMKAVVLRCYGSPDVLNVEAIAIPVPKADEVLVKVRAVSLNPLEWHAMRGSPYILRLPDGIGTPGSTRLGGDLAGTVAAVGKDVTHFKAGDEVYGRGPGGFAEYVVIGEDRALVTKPPGITFEDAAAIHVAAISALQGLRDRGQVRAGDRVLINGASGGVGTFAVQIAKAFGANVTAVCSTRNVEMVRSLGADHVIDYTKEDFARGAQRFDVILDNVGNRSLSDYRRVLKDDGHLVIVGAGKGNWIGPLLLPIKASILASFVDQKMGMFVATSNKADLQFLNTMIDAGQLKPVIDRRYPLSEVRAAMTYLESGRARGKVVVVMPSS